MDIKKRDLDTLSDNSDNTLSLPSGSDSNSRSGSPDSVVVGNNIIDEDNSTQSCHQMNAKHPDSRSNGLVRQQKVKLAFD